MKLMRVFALLLILPVRLSGQVQEAPPAPRPDERLKADIPLIVAHPDDETGVSTYLAQAMDQGKRVAAVYITHGEAGHNQMGPERAPALGATREMELRHALTSLGVQTCGSWTGAIRRARTFSSRSGTGATAPSWRKSFAWCASRAPK